MSQPGFFDVEDCYKALSTCGDPLEVLAEHIPWETFGYRLNKALKRSAEKNTGRPPFDAVMMFKILVLQSLDNLSDERMEFLIRDRLTFRRFLGIGLDGRVPDAKTIWLFRERLTQAGAIDKLFALFGRHLDECGLRATGGQIVDASFVHVPIQRNSWEENQTIKAGDVPEDWADKSPYDTLIDIWKSKPDLFKINPLQKTVGLNN
ncbi:MAG: transposase [Rhodospirillales bacterium]|nr:transposase [Rhodospirillales bacterium]MCB9964516.1 transposase [Rhodospirillales bacterium]MCB9973789.1 transposase [Rhodospirillales bacterium]MCB9980327.1 transposase [Rhodospirillales bacterium]